MENQDNVLMYKEINGKTILVQKDLRNQYYNKTETDNILLTQKVDKIGVAIAEIDLSNIENGVYGTVENPLIVTENTTISFNNLSLEAGYQKSFILCIKRTADVSVTWQDITKWAYDEIPLLAVDKVQKILVETTDGINYYGTGGDYFNV